MHCLTAQTTYACFAEPLRLSWLARSFFKQVYIAVAKQLSQDDITGIIVCMANAFGLFLVVTLLGYGLVEVSPAIYFSLLSLVLELAGALHALTLIS
jgi:hypothetical protein